MKAVIVTGANSGIGLYITQELVNSGYHVFACSRRETGFSSFEGLENVTPILLDVTVQATIDQAVDQLKSSNDELVGLVNNAGTAHAAPLAHVDIEDINRVLDVNLLGVHRMITSFFRLLIPNKGRIVNISSISGILSGPMFGVYSLSKHALEAYSDSLSQELKKFGMHVSLVEPGNYESNMSEEVIPISSEKMNKVEDNLYLGEFEKFKERLENPDGHELPAPQAVADAVEHAISAETPKMRYLVTDNLAESKATVFRAIIEMLQLNQNHQFSLSKQELIDTVSSFYDQDATQLQFFDFNSLLAEEYRNSDKKNSSSGASLE